MVNGNYVGNRGVKRGGDDKGDNIKMGNEADRMSQESSECSSSRENQQLSRTGGERRGTGGQKILQVVNDLFGKEG